MYINPYRFIAKKDGKIQFGAFSRARTFEETPALSAFLSTTQITQSQLDELPQEMASFLKEERYLTEQPMDIQSRHSRQIGFFSHAVQNPAEAQEKLAASTVLILGTGGLGSTTAYLLAAAGVGKLILVDDDVIEASNLNRQVMFGLADIGRHKVDVAEERLKFAFPDLQTETHCQRIRTEDDIIQLAKQADFIIRAIDEPVGIALTVDRAARYLSCPYISGGALEEWMTVGPFISPETGYFSDGPLPSLGTHSSCKKTPVFGPGIFQVASYVAGDAIRYLSGIASPWLTNRALYINLLTGKILSQSFSPSQVG